MSIAFRDLPVYDLPGATRNFEQLKTLQQNKGASVEGTLDELVLKKESVTTEKLAKPEAWKLLSAVGYKNSWEDLEASRKGEYRKNPFGNVELRGVIKAGESGKAAVTLPAGYRPKNTEAFVVRSAANTVATVEITATGETVPTNIGGEVKNAAFFDGINFSVE